MWVVSLNQSKMSVVKFTDKFFISDFMFHLSSFGMAKYIICQFCMVNRLSCVSCNIHKMTENNISFQNVPNVVSFHLHLMLGFYSYSYLWCWWIFLFMPLCIDKNWLQGMCGDLLVLNFGIFVWNKRLWITEWHSVCNEIWQAGRSQVSVQMRSLDFFNSSNPSSRTMALGLTQPLEEMSTGNIFLVG
jgi:hypothetical protein